MPDKKLTNYDRIRNMSVEELAVLLDVCDSCLTPYCRSKKADECDNNCLVCAKQWLESEVDNNG